MVPYLLLNMAFLKKSLFLVLFLGLVSLSFCEEEKREEEEEKKRDGSEVEEKRLLPDFWLGHRDEEKRLLPDFWLGRRDEEKRVFPWLGRHQARQTGKSSNCLGSRAGWGAPSRAGACPSCSYGALRDGPHISMKLPFCIKREVKN
ncbi:preprofallaxidin-9-like [Hyla sarda]|uniref:preprofallaxidin-9-like n=1 Tax=Hyla sarda TaxID=327740 RepID=UPI0024C2C349|nr:preprofallaxidin-9-like [Hyla sarda]